MYSEVTPYILVQYRIRRGISDGSGNNRSENTSVPGDLLIGNMQHPSESIA